MIVVAAGRLVPERRYDLLLESFARVRRAAAPVVLQVFGEGPERTRLEHRAATLGVDDSVRWTGFVDNPFPAIRRADLFVLSSDWEGLPNALLEAQALGVPAVATRCPTGPDEIVEDGVTGLLVPVRNPAALSDAILSLLRDPSRRAAMGRAAAGRVRSRFEASLVIEQWKQLLLDL